MSRSIRMVAFLAGGDLVRVVVRPGEGRSVPADRRSGSSAAANSSPSTCRFAGWRMAQATSRSSRRARFRRPRPGQPRSGDRREASARFRGRA